MDNLKSRILEIFKEFKTPANGGLRSQSLEIKIREWDRRSQDESQQAINELILERFIDEEDNFYILTQKGFDFLNEGYNILETEEIILNFIKERNIGVGNIIMQQWFTILLPKLDRIHFENFNTALGNILDKGFIEQNEKGLFLTQKGYQEIY